MPSGSTSNFPIVARTSLIRSCGVEAQSNRPERTAAGELRRAVRGVPHLRMPRWGTVRSTVSDRTVCVTSGSATRSSAPELLLLRRQWDQGNALSQGLLRPLLL